MRARARAACTRGHALKGIDGQGARWDARQCVHALPALRAHACAWVHVLMLDKLAPTHKDTKATSPKASFACMHTLAPALARVHSLMARTTCSPQGAASSSCDPCSLHSLASQPSEPHARAVQLHVLLAHSLFCAPCPPGPRHHQRAQVRLGGPSQPRPLHTVCCVLKLTAAPSCTPYPCLHRRGPCAAAPSPCTCTCACPTPRNGARTCSLLARVRAPGKELLGRMHTVGGKRGVPGPCCCPALGGQNTFVLCTCCPMEPGKGLVVGVYVYVRVCVCVCVHSEDKTCLCCAPAVRWRQARAWWWD